MHPLDSPWVKEPSEVLPVDFFPSESLWCLGSYKVKIHTPCDGGKDTSPLNSGSLSRVPGPPRGPQLPSVPCTPPPCLWDHPGSHGSPPCPARPLLPDHNFPGAQTWKGAAAGSRPKHVCSVTHSLFLKWPGPPALPQPCTPAARGRPVPSRVLTLGSPHPGPLPGFCCARGLLPSAAAAFLTTDRRGGRRLAPLGVREGTVPCASPEAARAVRLSDSPL